MASYGGEDNRTEPDTYLLMLPGLALCVAIGAVQGAALLRGDKEVTA